jgi:hypothetical protein
VGPFLFPLESVLVSNPLRDSWFPTALQDQVFLTAILWSAATHFKGLVSSTGAETHEELHGALLGLLRHSIESDPEPSDGALGAVSCLAFDCVRC